MQEFLFDTPFWFLAGAAIVGISLFVYGNRRTDATLSNIGAAIFGVGVVFFLMSWFVDTDKEKCLKRTKSLVQAVEKRDWATFDKLVASKCTVQVPGAGVIYDTREDLHKGTEIAVDKFGLQSNSVLGIDASNPGGFIKIGLSVLSYGNQGYPLSTKWELEWQNSTEGWQLTDLTAIKIGQETGTAMAPHFPK